jgi:hypothetical protein
MLQQAGAPMFTDQQKTDIRRHCGYPAYGSAPDGNMGWRFFTAYGALEYRLNNLSAAETTIVVNYLATLNQLEYVVPTASENLDSDAAAGWQHNRYEVADRLRLLDAWRRRLCAFLGVPPGEGLGVAGVTWVT